MMMYALHLIANDINFMADTTSIIDATVSFILMYLQWLVCSQDFNGVGEI